VTAAIDGLSSRVEPGQILGFLWTFGESQAANVEDGMILGFLFR